MIIIIIISFQLFEWLFMGTWRTKWSWKLLANDVAAYYIMDDNNNYKISIMWMIVYWNMMQPNDVENY